MEEKCPCQTDVHSCCACVSMHCDECHKPNRSKFVQGRFCSNCGRPLKAELIRSYVPKSEVERLQIELKAMKGAANSYKMQYEKSMEIHKDVYRLATEIKADMPFARAEIRANTAREIIDEFLNAMRMKHEENRPKYGGALALLLPDIEQIAAELKKKYTGEKT